MENLVDRPTEVKMIGDFDTICQVISLLAYIRNAIKSSQKKDILVKIGHNVTNGQFMFDVNGFEISDKIA
jgi:hypothetical protein